VNFKEYRTSMTTAIITGGTRGFGRALAGALLDEGWEVVLDGRDPTSNDAAARELGPHAHVVPGDVTDPVHRARLVAAAARIGGLALLVNNAGALGPTPLPHLRDVDPATLVELFRVNVAAPLGLAQAALPLLEEHSGAILDITSDAAVEAYEGWGAYGTTKAALEQMGAVLGREEARVRVWSFDPGDMRTEMHQDAFPGEDISDRPLPESVAPVVLRLLAERPPSGRIRSADVAGRATP